MESESLRLHKGGKLEINSRVSVENNKDLSLAYTPGVAIPCQKISEDKKLVYEYTIKGNSVAVVTDGSAVLGLGNIGPEAALPVMEGKAILFKRFADIDAFPICLATQDTEEIIKAVKYIAPVFGGINLEDISAPRCFEIESRLRKELDIPVFHDDQHGTAIVVLAGLINALKVIGKKLGDIKIVVSGAGAAGIATAKILLNSGVKDVIVTDSNGALYDGRKNMNPAKEEIARLTNKEGKEGSLKDVIKDSDVFIGLSAPNVLTKDMVGIMNQPIIFAMANPVPEIMPDDALEAGAKVVATGRSDFPNQINNVLAFPGVFRGALDAKKKITEEMKVAAANALAELVESPEKNKIVPDVFDKRVVKAVSNAVKTA